MRFKLFKNNQKAVKAFFACNLLLVSVPVAVSAAENASVLSIQQQRTKVSGTVVDAKGEPIIGASIRVRGSKTGVITDLDGKFLINVPLGSTLTISYVGYDTQNVTVQKTNLRIVLEDNSTMLNDVQVIAYGVQKKVTVTGAISGVNGEELLKTPTGSITNMLSGQLPGLSSVQYSGEPGADAATILVRGKATFGDSSPLVQVDGVERDFNDIDPNEIESLTVLKDASATAVFGIRGANGVILITTKRGKEGKAHISFSTSASVVMPNKMIKLANAYEYASYYNQMLKNDNSKSVPFSDAILQKFKDHSDPIRFPDTDWMDYAFKSAAWQTQHNVNISGGMERFKYFVSVGAFTQEGLFKQLALPYDFNFNYKRFNYRANLDFEATKTTTISLNLGGRTDTKNKPISGQDNNQLFRELYGATPFSSPGIINGKYILTSTDYEDYPLPFTGASGLGSYYGKGYMSTNNNVLTIDLTLNQRLDMITKGLSFKVKGSYNSSYSVLKSRGASVATYNPVLQEDGTIEYRKLSEDSQLGYGESSGKGRNWYFEGSFNYNRAFGNHHVGALLLYNQSKEYYPGSYSDIPHGYVGLVGRVTYDWKNKYLADFNIGYNGSENYAPERRYGIFPAGSLGWIISEEKFWQPLKSVISFFKVRASIGKVGNDRASGDRFLYTPDPYTLGGGYNFGTNTGSNKPGAYEGSKHNPFVTWETAVKQDYGVEMNFLNDRLKVIYDYYMEHRQDIMLHDGTAPGILGFTLPYANMGKVDSWGHEISIKWGDKIGNNLRYWIEPNLSYNQNKIVDMREAPQNYAYMMTTGHRIGARSIMKFWRFYDEQSAALYQQQFGMPFPKHLTGSDGNELLEYGDATYVDLNGDGVIDNNDYSRELGYTDDPEFIVGLNMGFKWKSWTVTMQWTGAWNVSRMLDETFRQPLGDTNKKGLLKYQYEHTWTPENPSQDSQYPRATSTHAANNYAASTLYEVDAKYLRLKSLQIAYNFDFPFMRKIKMNTCTLAFSGYNLFTLTPFKWGDPESRTSSRPSYPLTRTFSLSLKVGF